MAGAWDISDAALLSNAENYRLGYLQSLQWVFHLYQNDFVPTPGVTLGDFTEATFAGYDPVTIGVETFTTQSVTDHVATIPSTETLLFPADEDASPQTIYGYFVTNPEDDSYQWCERFDTPRLVNPGDTVTIKPRMKVRTYPAS